MPTLHPLSGYPHLTTHAPDLTPRMLTPSHYGHPPPVTHAPDLTPRMLTPSHYGHPPPVTHAPPLARIRYAESIVTTKAKHAVQIDGHIFTKKIDRKRWVTYRCNQHQKSNCTSVCNIDKDMRIIKEPGPHSHPLIKHNERQSVTSSIEPVPVVSQKGNLFLFEYTF